MAILITVMALGLVGAILYCAYLNNELADERNRRFEAEAWIDPISWEETK